VTATSQIEIDTSVDIL